MSQQYLLDVRSRRAFDYLLPLLLGGYMLFGRPFAYLHIPGTPIFVGEIVLLFGLGGAMHALTWRRAWRRSNVPLLLSLYVGWGFIRFLPGFMGDPVVALRDAVVWAYALVAWAVVGVLAARPANLQRWLHQYLKVIPFAVVWLPLAIFISSIDLGTIPDSDISITSLVGMGQVHLVLIVAFLWLVWVPSDVVDARWRTLMSVLALLGIMVLATNSRGGLVAAIVGLAILLWMFPSRTRLVATLARGLLAIAIVVVIIDPQIELGERDVSASQLANNVNSLFTFEGGPSLGGNISWRLEHWSNILDGVNRDVPLVGHGFGPNIAEIYRIPQVDIGLRNAHNTHLTILARAGWIGLILWVALWVSFFFEVNRARLRLRGAGMHRLSGLAAWVICGVAAAHVEAIFNPSIEGPPAAFWLWSLMGVGLFLSVVSTGSRLGDGSHIASYDLQGIDAALATITRSRRSR